METQQRPPPSGHWGADAPARIEYFQHGEEMARECLDACCVQHARTLLAGMIAGLIERGEFDDLEAGFVSLLARKSYLGAKPSDLDSFAGRRVGDDRAAFLSGMRAAIVHMANPSEIDLLLPARILCRVETAILSGDRSAEFAGYITAIISSATACRAH